MKNEKGYTVVELVFCFLAIFGGIGWVMNIVDVVHSVNNPITGMFILRCIGILVAPLGAILGYC